MTSAKSAPQTSTRPLVSPDGSRHSLSTATIVGFQLILRPNGTKTSKCQQSGPHLVIVKQDRQHSFLVRLPLYIQYMYPSVGIWSSYLFSPLTADHQSFADAPLKATSLGHRLNKHLEDAKVDAGESNHGFRRGQVQATVADLEGIPRAHYGYCADQNPQDC